MIIRKIPKYCFQNLKLSILKDGSFLKEPFYITFPVPVQRPADRSDTVLLDIPGALTIRMICRSYIPNNPPYNRTYDWEGCFYYQETDEWILEAECYMTTADGTYSNTYVVRLPLSAPFAEGTIGFWFDGTWLRFMKDGAVLNENSGLDLFSEATGVAKVAEEWAGQVMVGNTSHVEMTYTELTEEGNADFFSPLPWNSFAGDVMNFYHDGIYHLIYLRDRRHHGSRNGEGGHDIYQLTSRDLIHWEEQVPIAPIDAPWKTYGTGTMLFHKGKYYMVYGYHTERYYGANPQVDPSLDESTQTFPLIDGKRLFQEGKLPAGASYSVSDDGIHFTPSYVLFHPGRNPSTYVTPEGKLKLYAGYMGTGIWESDGFNQAFHQTDEDFSFIEKSVMKNSTECPCAFTWNGYKYLVIGFTGYYRSLTPGGEYVDMAGQEEIYDGLCVPMISTFSENRRIMAGWLNGIGWGSVIVHRELIQEEQGRLGMKWVPEMVPKVQKENLIPDPSRCEAALESMESYLLEMQINPKGARRLGIQLLSGEKAVELQLNFQEKRVQVSAAMPHCLAQPLPTSFEVLTEQGENANWRNAKVAYSTKDFCLGGIEGMTEAFSLRILVRTSRKMRSTVLDAEIAGRRTILSVRKDFFPERVCTIQEGTVDMANATLSRLKYKIM